MHLCFPWLICPHAHEQNGTIEHCHRHIIKISLTLLGKCNALLRFWDYAFESSVYLINHMPTLVLQNQSSFEYLFHHTPDYDFLRTFGCLCFPFYVHIMLISWIFIHLHMLLRLYFLSSWLLLSWFNISTCLRLLSCLFSWKCVFSFAKSEQIAQHTTTSSNILYNLYTCQPWILPYIFTPLPRQSITPAANQTR